MSKGYRNIDPSIRAEFLNWLLTPPMERVPTSKAKFAEEYGVSESTLRYWEKSDDFQAELKKIKGLWGSRWHGDILGRLYGIVQNGSDAAAIQASKVLLQHLHLDEDAPVEEEIEGEALDAIRRALEEEGYTVINRES